MGHSRDIIIFEGHLGREQVDGLLARIQEKLEESDMELITRKRVYSASVECLDNILKHADPEAIPEKLYHRYPSRFKLRERDESFSLEVANVLRQAETEGLRERLNKLNHLQKGEINELYKRTIKEGTGLSDKGGAGLGLIVLAKTTDEPLWFRFQSIDNEHAYFTLIIHIT